MVHVDLVDFPAHREWSLSAINWVSGSCSLSDVDTPGVNHEDRSASEIGRFSLEFFELLRGWRHLEVTERRTAVDFAHQMKWLVDRAYPQAEVICVVLDNLNTHNIALLDKTFEPHEARKEASTLEFQV
mgnify:CR=1 FL=1|jgi:hypothetical protein